MSGEIILWSLFPLLLVNSLHILPPIFFAGASNIVAGCIILLSLAVFRRSSLYFPKKAIPPAIIGASLVLLIFFPLVFISGQHIPAGDTAILLQMEVFFSFLIFGIFGLETIHLKRLIGAVIILLGTTTILFQGFSGELSKWNIILIGATAIAPLANYYQKQAALLVSPLLYTGYRSFIGGIILLSGSLLFEVSPKEVTLSHHALLLIVINGILAFGISKWFWLESIRRIGVIKAISYGAATPACTLIFAFLFFHETVTIQQVIGLIAVIIGVPLIMTPVKIHTFVGMSVSGDGIGKKMGFPTLNLRTEKHPPKGVFTVQVQINKKSYRGIMHSGPRPTLTKKEHRTEIHLFDFSQDVKKETKVEVEIIKKIRNIRSFRNRDALKKQIIKDVAKAKTE